MSRSRRNDQTLRTIIAKNRENDRKIRQHILLFKTMNFYQTHLIWRIKLVGNFIVKPSGILRPDGF